MIYCFKCLISFFFWRIVLFIICSYSAVTSIASALSLCLSSLPSSQTPGNLSHNRTESFRRRRLDSELGDNIASHLHSLTLLDSTSPSLFCFLTTCYRLPPPTVEDNERANEQSLLMEPGLLSSKRIFKPWHSDVKILQKCVWRLERFYRCPCLGMSEVQSASHQVSSDILYWHPCVSH